VEAEGLAFNTGAGFDRDTAVRPLNLRVARRRRLQSQINEILVLRCASLFERRVQRRGDRVCIGCVRIGVVARIVLRGVLLGRGLLRVVVAIVVRGFRGRFL